MPHATTVGRLSWILRTRPMRGLRHEIEAAASAAGIKVVAASASSKAEIAPAFQQLSHTGAQGFDRPARWPLSWAESERMTELARAARVPTVP